MGSRLADRLRAARQRRFVGRDTERDLFLRALRADEPPFVVLHFYGPGGIGKTTLLRTLAALCTEENATALHLDGRTVDPNPVTFVNALRAVLGLGEDAAPLDVLAATPQRYVLLVDTFELLTSLDDWLREVFLPDLPDNVLVVTAGRNPKSSEWHADPGWQVLLREVPLQAFTHEESRHFLDTRHINNDQHGPILKFTHGHPLALSLVADLFEQQPDLVFEPESTPDMIKALVDQFVQHVPSPAHRAAIEACALVRVVNETLLANMLGVLDAHEIFAWMRRVSFIDAGPFGLEPHDLARDALTQDLRWRNPEWYAELHNRARAYYGERIEQTRGREQQRILSDYMFLHRDNPVIKPFIDWGESGGSVPEPPTDDDLPILRGFVAQHESEASAQIADYWFAREREGILVFRGVNREPTGFLQMIPLDATTAEDRATDPAMEQAWQYLAAHAPLRTGERATYIRFWMAADTYQDVSPLQSLLFLKMAQHYLTAPDLAFSFFPCANADFWAPFCGYTELERIPDADFEVGDQTYGLFGHDWRAIPPMLWLDHLAARELGTADKPADTDDLPTLTVLHTDAFEAAVRDALKAYTRPFDLRENPLLHTRLVTTAAGIDADDDHLTETLLRLIKDAADLLQADPRDMAYYRVLDRTYFRPARSQEIAAEQLNLSISTFRRYLKRGIEHINDTLWQQEAGA